MCVHITCFVFHIACFLFHIACFLLLIKCQSEKQFLSTSCWGSHRGLFLKPAAWFSRLQHFKKIQKMAMRWAVAMRLERTLWSGLVEEKMAMGQTENVRKNVRKPLENPEGPQVLLMFFLPIGLF